MKTPFNVLRHVNQWEMAPRDPVTVGGYILAGLSGAGVSAVGAAVATAVFGTTAAYIVGFLATTAITSWALSALAPDIGGIGGSRGLLVNSSDPAAPHDIVYGTVRKGGIRTYVEATGDENKFLHMIIVLAGHEVAGIDDIYLGDETVTLDGDGFVTSGDWNSKVRIKKHLGNETVADADLLAESNQINLNFVGNGIAYLYIRLEYDQDVFANGIPLVTAKVRGRKVYDPRTALTGYSANAALVVRDYLTAGFGLADSAVDDVMFATSANVSDEPVTLAAAGSEPRYEINGVVSSDMSPREIVSRMMTACGGTLFWGQGKWQLHVGYYSPPVKTFTLDDLRGPINLDTRVGARDNFNRVVGTFADKEVDYITVDFPPIESAAFKTEDNEIENTLDMQLPLTTSESAAQRLAKMTLFRAREQMTFSADFGLEAFSVQVGDIVAFTNSRYGWTEKEFEVVGWKFEASSEGGDLRVNLTLRETSEAAFAWDAEESAIIHNNSNLPVFTAGLTINGLTASGGGKTQKDGTFIASSIISWTAGTNAFISHYEIEWKPLADSSYSSTTTTQNSIELSPIIDAVEYIFRVRAITTVGNGGPQASVNYTAGGDVTAPALPTAITATGGFQHITVKWTRPADKDFNYVEVYENTSNTTVGATKIGISTGDEFVRTNLGNEQTFWYFLKSVDYSGNVSGFTSGESGTTTSISDPDFANGIYSLFTDQGLYAIRDVTSLPPSGAFTGEKVFNRTDGKLYQWTGSAWVLVVADVADGSITEVKIDNDAITAPKIAANAVTANAILGGTITGDKITANTITGGLIAATGIITSSAQIGNGLITNALIGDTIQSNNFISGSTGWRVQKTGNAEFNDIDVRGNIANFNEKFLIGISGNWYRFLDNGTNRSLNNILNQLGGAGTYAFVLVGGGGSGAIYSSTASNVATGGGAGGLANFIYTWNGSTALTADIGAGGAGKTSASGPPYQNGSAGAASRFKIAGTTRATANGGGGGVYSSTNTASGGAGGTVSYSAASTYFPILSRSVNGSRGGNITTASLGTTGGGGIDAFGFASSTPNGGDVTSANLASSGGGVWGRGVTSVSLNEAYGATIYKPAGAVDYSADTLGGGFLSSFGAEDLIGGFGVFNNSLSNPSAGNGGAFSGGGSHGNSATSSDRDDAIGGNGGIGGGGGAGLADSQKRSGAGGNGALFISRIS